MAVATRISDVARGAFVGKYTGTTAAQNIHIGFKPAYIRAYNRTDGDTIWEWYKDDIVNITVTTTAVAAAAVVITQVDNGTVLGFALPSNAVVNEDGKVYAFVAFPE
jgi:hypothetical protein